MGAGIVGGSFFCDAAIQSAFSEIGMLLVQSPGCRRELEKIFNICGVTPLENENNQGEFLMDITGVFPVQTNDPSCTSSGCNIANTCGIMLNTSLGSVIDRLAVLVAIQNGPTCMDVSHDDDIATYTNTTLIGGQNRIWYVHGVIEDIIPRI